APWSCRPRRSGWSCVRSGCARSSGRTGLRWGPAPHRTSRPTWWRHCSRGPPNSLSMVVDVGGQQDLFGAEPEPGRRADAPLASRLRPSTFDELVGQERAVKVLRSLAESGRLPSIVLWGPPGSGKTTLAAILARATGSRFVAISAVTSGVPELR